MQRVSQLLLGWVAATLLTAGPSALATEPQAVECEEQLEVHVGNYASQIPFFRSQVFQGEIDRATLNDLNSSTTVQLGPWVLRVDSVHPYRRIFATRMIGGEIKYFEIDGASALRDWFDRTILRRALPEVLPIHSIPPPRGRWRAHRYDRSLRTGPARNVRLETITAGDLTSSQLTPDAARSDVERANQDTLHHLRHHREFFDTDLERINLEVTRASTETITVNGEDFLLNVMSGIIRGGPPRLRLIDGHLRSVDISRTEMTSGNTAQYLPAAEVPAAVTELIDRINAITRETPFRRLVDIYRDFLLIHPFVDGNGRTARVLLDYMLLRAGFPPVPHDDDLTRLVLFYSSDEVYARFTLAYVRGHRPWRRAERLLSKASLPMLRRLIRIE